MAKNGMPHQTFGDDRPPEREVGVGQDVVGRGEDAESESQCGSGPTSD